MSAFLSAARVIFYCLLSGLVLNGCRNKTAPTTAPAPTPASAQMYESVRQQLMAADPNIRVGLVTQIMPDAHLAEVRGVDTREFSEGAAFTFMDTAQNTLVNGRVVFINPEALHVRFENPRVGSGERAPREGDLAVHFKLPS
jgi:hypothetical protein